MEEEEVVDIDDTISENQEEEPVMKCKKSVKTITKKKKNTKKQTFNTFHKEVEHTGNFDDEEHEISGITARKVDKFGEVIYKVKWKGWTQENWLSVRNLEGAKETIEEFNNSITCDRCEYMANTPQSLRNHKKKCKEYIEINTYFFFRYYYY